MAYYSNVNPDLLAAAPTEARHVLEVGCGSGAFAAAYKERNPACRYVGVELFPEAAAAARGVVDHLEIGSIEDAAVMQALDAARGDTPFDLLIFGDVLEHLHDPWAVLAALRARTAPDGVCVACIPNIGHWSIIRQLMAGRWDYADSGLLDRTHLRFFTVDTAIAMFRTAGWTFSNARSRILWPDKTEAALADFLPLAPKLGVPADKFRRDLSAFQWIIRAANKAASPAPA